MTKSTITRERLEALAKAEYCKSNPGAGLLGLKEVNELARMALAAMDSEPVAWLLSGGGAKNVVCFDSGNAYADPLREVTPLYRHAQPVTVVSAELLHTAASAIEDLLTTKDMTGACVWFDLPFRLRSAANAQPAPVVPELMVDWQENEFSAGWNACRAAMLAAAPQSPGSEPDTVPGKWIPVSERMPLTPSADCEYSDIEVNVFDGERVFTAHYATGSQPQPWGYWVDTYAKITNWQPLPAAPQEVK